MSAAPGDVLAYATPPKHGPVFAFARELSVAAAYTVLLGALWLFAPHYFNDQFWLTCVDAAPVLIAAIGMTLVIVARHIDISIGSQLSICAVVAGVLAKEGVPMPAVALITIALGALMGAFNGLFVAFVGLPSIVVTLATMVILREILRWARQGDTVRNLPQTFQWLGLPQANGRIMLVGSALLLLLFFVIFMRWLRAGRAVYAVGSDIEAARLSGIRPAQTVFAIFTLMGALTGIAAVVSATRFPYVQTNLGEGLELKVIAAVVVGGAAVSGGRGTLFGTLIGVALLETIRSALPFFGVAAEWYKAVAGAIILVAVASDVFYRRAQ